MKYYFSCIVAIVLTIFVHQLSAQTAVPNNTISKFNLPLNAPVKIGDDVSELYLGKIINHPTLKEAYVNTFKGKLLILDFWNTFCSICIKSFPHLDSLQAQYKDKLVILPVGFDGLKNGSIEEWVAKRIGTNYGLRSLPSAVQAPEDTALFKMFPTQGFPYEIWIDPNGVVIGMTDHTFVNANNIQKILNGEKPELTSKRFVKHFISGCQSSMDKVTIERSQRLDIGSRLTGYIDTIAGGFAYSLQCDSSYARLSYINSSVVELYKSAYSIIDSNISVADKREKKVIIIEKGRPFYKRRKDYLGKGEKASLEFMKTGLFCYDLVLPKSFNEHEAAKIMIQDLDRFFLLKSSVELRPEKCLVLVRTSNKEKFKAKAEFRVPDLTNDPYDVKLRSTTTSSLASLISYWIDPIIIDNTNYIGKIDIDLNMNKVYSLEEVRDILKKYDLDLVEEVRNIPMLIIENK